MKLSSIKFPPYMILHHIEKAWLFLWIPKTYEKWSKTHPVMKTWDINNHTFHIEGSVLSSNSYRLRYYITFELHGFSHEFPRAWKKARKSILRECSAIGVPIFLAREREIFFPRDSHCIGNENWIYLYISQILLIAIEFWKVPLFELFSYWIPV